MSEYVTPSDDIVLHGRTLEEWTEYLMQDGDLDVPCSRYGRKTSGVVPWALACELIYCEANGENSDEDPTAALNHFMNLAVNDHADILELVRDYWFAIPESLKAQLDYEDGQLNMHQQAALWSLCKRYGVEFDADHYKPAYDLPEGYVAGWIGGQRHANPEYAIPEEPRGKATIYVGCSAEGEVSS